jgi:hypothetical protein
MRREQLQDRADRLEIRTNSTCAVDYPSPPAGFIIAPAKSRSTGFR